MKRSGIVTVLTVMVLAMAAVPAMAGTTVIPFETTVTNDCTGEPIDIEGTLRVVTQELGGGSIERSSIHDVTARGMETGSAYLVTPSPTVIRSGPTSVTVVDRLAIVGPDGSVFSAYTTFHFTEVDGRLVAWVDIARTECRGRP